MKSFIRAYWKIAALNFALVFSMFLFVKVEEELTFMNEIALEPYTSHSLIVYKNNQQYLNEDDIHRLLAFAKENPDIWIISKTDDHEYEVLWMSEMLKDMLFEVKGGDCGYPIVLYANESLRDLYQKKNECMDMEWVYVEEGLGTNMLRTDLFKFPTTHDGPKSQLIIDDITGREIKRNRTRFEQICPGCSFTETGGSSAFSVLGLNWLTYLLKALEYAFPLVYILFNLIINTKSSFSIGVGLYVIGMGLPQRVAHISRWIYFSQFGSAIYIFIFSWAMNNIDGKSVCLGVTAVLIYILLQMVWLVHSLSDENMKRRLVET